MEGVELFDNKFFSLSAHESGNLDPHMRMVLEAPLIHYMFICNMI